MKVYAGITTITDALIAQGNYAAADAIQQIIRNLDLPAIDGGGQLITLIASDSIEFEALGGGSYKANAIGQVGSSLLKLPIYTTLPILADGEAAFGVMDVNSEEHSFMLGFDVVTPFTPRNIAWLPIPESLIVSTDSVVATGQFGKALSFDGTAGGRYFITNTPNLIMGTDGFSFELWLNPTAFHGPLAIAEQNYDGNNGAGGFYCNVSNAGLAAFGGHGDADVVNATVAITLNQWNYMLYERVAGVGRWFINGQAAGVDTDTHDYSMTCDHAIRLGGIQNGEPSLVGLMEGICLRPLNTYSAGGAVVPPLPTALRSPTTKKSLVIIYNLNSSAWYDVVLRTGMA